MEAGAQVSTALHRLSEARTRVDRYNCETELQLRDPLANQASLRARLWLARERQLLGTDEGAHAIDDVFYLERAIWAAEDGATELKRERHAGLIPMRTALRKAENECTRTINLHRALTNARSLRDVRAICERWMERSRIDLDEAIEEATKASADVELELVRAPGPATPPVTETSDSNTPAVTAEPSRRI